MTAQLDLFANPPPARVEPPARSPGLPAHYTSPAERTLAEQHEATYRTVLERLSPDDRVAVEALCAERLRGYTGSFGLGTMRCSLLRAWLRQRGREHELPRCGTGLQPVASASVAPVNGRCGEATR